MPGTPVGALQDDHRPLADTSFETSCAKCAALRSFVGLFSVRIVACMRGSKSTKMDLLHLDNLDPAHGRVTFRLQPRPEWTQLPKKRCV
jgi:hypothetical protein